MHPPARHKQPERSVQLLAVHKAAAIRLALVSWLWMIVFAPGIFLFLAQPEDQMVMSDLMGRGMNSLPVSVFATGISTLGCGLLLAGLAALLSVRINALLLLRVSLLVLALPATALGLIGNPLLQMKLSVSWELIGACWLAMVPAMIILPLSKEHSPEEKELRAALMGFVAKAGLIACVTAFVYFPLWMNAFVELEYGSYQNEQFDAILWLLPPSSLRHQVVPAMLLAAITLRLRVFITSDWILRFALIVFILLIETICVFLIPIREVALFQNRWLFVTCFSTAWLAPLLFVPLGARVSAVGQGKT